MFGWIGRLFRSQEKEYDTFLPPFTVDAIAPQEVNEVIDWGLQALGIPDIWKKTQGEGVKVAVLDTGIATSHPDLKSAIVASKDFTKDGVEDKQGHGTHCAGIVAARHNDVGVIGVAPKADLMIGKVLNNYGSGRFEWIIDGMKWAVDEGADIISMSLGASQGSDALEQAVKDVIAAGKILIVAAGNSGEGSDTIKYPGHYEDVICVGSIDSSLERSDFSSTGPNIVIIAPGEGVFSCYPPDKFARLSGTSMATPFVAGVAALILSKHRKSGGKTPCSTQHEMLEHLTKVAIDMEDDGRDHRTGWGIINPKKSMDEKHAKASQYRK